MFLALLFCFSRDFDIYTFWTFLTLSVFPLAVFSIVNGAPSTWVYNLTVWDIKTEIFGREFIRFPTAPLVVILDDEPETVIKVEFDGEEQALVGCVISCLISYSFECSSFEEFLRDVAASPSIKGYAGFENFLGSRRRREVRFNVTRRWLMVGLNLSLLFLT